LRTTNILVKIKPVKMDFIVFANAVETARAKTHNPNLGKLKKI
jgi:hypothetical protein